MVEKWSATIFIEKQKQNESRKNEVKKQYNT